MTEWALPGGVAGLINMNRTNRNGFRQQIPFLFSYSEENHGLPTMRQSVLNPTTRTTTTSAGCQPSATISRTLHNNMSQWYSRISQKKCGNF